MARGSELGFGADFLLLSSPCSSSSLSSLPPIPSSTLHTLAMLARSLARHLLQKLLLGQPLGPSRFPQARSARPCESFAGLVIFLCAPLALSFAPPLFLSSLCSHFSLPSPSLPRYHSHWVLVVPFPFFLVRHAKEIKDCVTLSLFDVKLPRGRSLSERDPEGARGLEGRDEGWKRPTSPRF
jgi:hypothetical protein